MRGLTSKLVDGYKLSYTDESVITHYSVLVSGAGLAGIERDYNRLRQANPAALRRPENLHGLSPWTDYPAPRRPAPAIKPEQARALIGAMDARGAWLKPGTIGKADRLVFVYAAKPMVVRIGRRASDGGTGDTGLKEKSQIVELHENDTLEVFQGPQPPLEQIVNSQNFAENLEALGRYNQQMR